LSGSFLLAGSQLEDDAIKTAEQWLSIVDAGDYAKSWMNSALLFQNAVPKNTFTSQLNAVRKPLGALISRKLIGAEHTKSLPGAPEGEYVVLQFDTSFENKKTAIETLTPMLEKDGQWKVSGYFIK
jgi:hypothetical protein